MKQYNIFIFISFLSLFALSACNTHQFSIPTAKNGVLDLRQWDFENRSSIALDGEWSFTPTIASLSRNSYLQLVPSEWKAQRIGEPRPNVGTYSLKILVPKQAPILGLKVDGISTAYILKVNGQVLGQVGKPTERKHTTIPSYQHRKYTLFPTDSVYHISIEVANFHHYKGGIVSSIILGDKEQLVRAIKTNNIIGGIVIGVLFINAFIYFALFFMMRTEKSFLYYALFVLIVLIHMLCLADRFLYTFLTENFWFLAYKIELSTIFIAFAFKLLFYQHFFNQLISVKITRVFCGLFLAEALFIFLAPAPLFTYIDLIISYNALLLLLLILYIFTKSNILYRGETRTVILFAVFLLCILVGDNFFLDKSYHDLQLVQFACIFYITGVSILHIKRIVKVIENEKKLTHALQETNVLLAEQKQGLEEMVERRTAQLLDVEKQSHELEMKMKENDLNMLSASNMLKYQFSKNLIEELNELPKQDKELKIALNALINKLKSQVVLEERVDILQKDMLRVNAEFYDRMHTRFPDLSKTERELCAFIKLNLSNKDIAELRKTTLNTINVTRSRLRKKLGLTRDEELESFIQQI